MIDHDDDCDDYDDDTLDEPRLVFARPGSALRAADDDNPRNLPCPTCGEANRLTPADARCGYQCDECADHDEGG